MTGQPLPPPTNEELRRAVLHLTRSVSKLNEALYDTVKTLEIPVSSPAARKVVIAHFQITEELRLVVDEIVKEPPDNA